MNPQKYTLQQFGQQIKSKYPGAYDNIPDEQLGQQVIQKYPQYGANIVQADNQSPLQKFGGFLHAIGLGAIPDILGSGYYAGQRIAQGQNPLQAPSYQDAQNLKQSNPFLSSGQIQKTGGIKQAAQDEAGAASYLIPFGKGATIATKVLLPGAVSGGLQAYSANQNPVEGALTGAAGAGTVHGALSILSPVLGKIGDLLGVAGTKTLRSQYNVAPTTAAKNAIFSTIQDLSQKYGIHTPEDVQKVAPIVTGENGIVNQLKQNAIAQANPVSMDNIMSDTQHTLDDLPLINGTKTAKNFMQIIKNGIFGAAGQGGNQITSMDPTKTFQFIQNLEGQGYDLMGGNASQTEKQLGKAYLGVANNLKDRLFNDAGANDVVLNQALTPQQYQTLHQISPNLAQDVASAKTIKDLRSIESPFVRGSNLANQSIDRVQNKPFNAGDALVTALTGLNPKLLLLLGGKKFLESDTGKTVVGKGLMGAGDVMKGAAQGQAANGYKALLDMLGAKTATAGMGGQN